MENIKILVLNKYSDSGKYEFIEEGIYKDLNDTWGVAYRISLCFDLEEGDDSQYPLEDVLDKFRVHVSDSLESENSSPERLVLEFAGDLDNIQGVATLVGKRVYNKDVIAEDGKSYIHLIIE